jgi:radical SAM protein with 4Fe4S-binding SPASM domain
MSSIGITSDGNVSGCLSMGNDRFLEGNVRNRRLIDIWNDPRSFAYNRIPEKMLPGDNCRDCRNFSKCGGGCDSVSYALTGEFHNNPYCFYAIEKELGIR